MYQSLTIVGNLTNDPELRFTPNGVPVASFGVAVNRKWTGQDGQSQEKVTYFRISVWNKQAEIVSQYLTKGRQVLVVGEMEDARAFQDKEGNLRASLEVRANSVRFLGQRGDDAPVPHGSNNGNGASNSATTDFSVADSEELPF